MEQAIETQINIENKTLVEIIPTQVEYKQVDVDKNLDELYSRLSKIQLEIEPWESRKQKMIQAGIYE